MLQAQGLAIGVAAPALLGGEVRITRILAQDPVLRLETAKGRVNWEFSPTGASGGAATPSGGGSGGQLVTLDGLDLRNARLIYVEEGKTSFDFGGVDLSASWPATDAPLKMEARLEPGAGPISVDLDLADLSAFSNGQVSAMQMKMTAPKTSITFDGRASIDGALAGAAVLDTSDSAAMLAAFGQAGISLPRGLGQRADLRAQITYTADGRLALRELAADLDGNRAPDRRCAGSDRACRRWRDRLGAQRRGLGLVRGRHRRLGAGAGQWHAASERRFHRPAGVGAGAKRTQPVA